MPRALRVPQITVFFWIIKGLSTALGESTSDYLVHAMAPVLAVALGFVGFAVAMALQFSRRRYVAWAYWFAVVMVGVFGTMAADVLHVGFGVPYWASSLLCAVGLVAIFCTWEKLEQTLSIHSIDSPRREFFYWATVIATFALGTAVGDLAALTLNLGYLVSAGLFAGAIAVVGIAFRRGLNPVAAFWAAYVMTRPLGASLADWAGKPATAGGLGLGAAPVAGALALLTAILVAYLTLSHRDVQPSGPRRSRSNAPLS